MRMRGSDDGDNDDAVVVIVVMAVASSGDGCWQKLAFDDSLCNAWWIRSSIHCTSLLFVCFLLFLAFVRELLVIVSFIYTYTHIENGSKTSKVILRNAILVLPILRALPLFGNNSLRSLVLSETKLLQSTESMVELLAPIVPVVWWFNKASFTWGSGSCSCDVLLELPIRNFSLKGAIVDVVKDCELICMCMPLGRSWWEFKLPLSFFLLG